MQLSIYYQSFKHLNSYRQDRDWPIVLYVHIHCQLCNFSSFHSWGISPLARLKLNRWFKLPAIACAVIQRHLADIPSRPVALFISRNCSSSSIVSLRNLKPVPHHSFSCRSKSHRLVVLVNRLVNYLLNTSAICWSPVTSPSSVKMA